MESPFLPLHRFHCAPNSNPMFPPVSFPLPYLRLPPLSRRRVRLIHASSYSRDDDELSKLRKIFPRARDKKIEIGRYKGRMLGTLPSSYLKWLADQHDNTAYDLYDWPQLAKLVLEDPVYRDRIEYEPALRIFEGGAKGNFIFREGFDIIRAYRDIGDRYGWDWEDKEGWSRVKRDYIGTSYSGRIPRKKKGGSVQSGVSEKKDTGFLDDQKARAGFSVGRKRGERIGRMRVKREERMQMVQSKVVEEEVVEEEGDELPPLRSRVKKERARKVKGDIGRRKREFGLERKDEIVGFAKVDGSSENGEVFNPFPGREALFRKLKREGKIK